MGAGPPASAHLDSGCPVAQEKGVRVLESDQPRFHSRLQPSARQLVTSASASLPLKGRDSYSLIHLSELGGQWSGNTKLPCASVSPRVKRRGYWCPLTGLREDGELRLSMRGTQDVPGPGKC